MNWSDPTQQSELQIKGLDLILTCSACPEQYDVFLDGQPVGYLRLRHGEFTAEYPECDGELVYRSEDMQGDGIFEPQERLRFLEAACEALLAANERQKGKRC